MRTALKIAGHELKLMFCSPVAWLLLVIFLYQFGDAFAGSLSNAKGALDFYPGYTSWLFSGILFPKAEGNIYLYIPLMTMGLMSNELNSGSIKLLFSAPVKTRNIVLGKYLGIMGYWLIVISLFFLYSFPPYFVIANLDLGIVLPGILAIFLLACTYSAIGLFMSCLTTYQVVAALSTLTTLAALNYIGGMWQGVPILKDVVNFLHIAGHAGNMNAGFIKSRDIVYFIIITLLFLGLAIFYMEDTIRFRAKLSKARRYTAFTALMLLLGCIFSLRQFTLYFDTTATKSNTISSSSQAILRKIKGPVSVTAYTNLLENGDYAVGNVENRLGDFGFWEPYIRFLPQLELKYVNYYASLDTTFTPESMKKTAIRIAEGNGWYIEDYLAPKQIDRKIKLKPEGYRFIRMVEQNGKRHFIRVFNDIIHRPLEQEIITAFNGLHTTYPKIAFLSGHYERSIVDNEDRAYKSMVNEGSSRSSLINLGFEVQTVSKNSSIPKDIDVLVIADPLSPYTPAEITKIQDYVAAGGNLLVTGGPKSQKILNPVVNLLGVRFMEGQLVQKNKDFSEEMVFTHSPLREGGDPYVFQFPAQLGMPASVGLQYQEDAGFKVEQAVVTDEESTWNRIGEIPTDTSEIAYQPKNGDIHSELPVAVSMTRNVGEKQQRVMVIGNGSFMSNENLVKDYNKVTVANADFATAIFKWLCNEKYPLTVVPHQHSKDTDLLVTQEKLDKIRPYYTWLLPVLVLLSGAIFLFRRRRK